MRERLVRERDVLHERASVARKEKKAKPTHRPVKHSAVDVLPTLFARPRRGQFDHLGDDVAAYNLEVFDLLRRHLAEQGRGEAPSARGAFEHAHRASADGLEQVAQFE